MVQIRLLRVKAFFFLLQAAKENTRQRIRTHVKTLWKWIIFKLCIWLYSSNSSYKWLLLTFKKWTLVHRQNLLLLISIWRMSKHFNKASALSHIYRCSNCTVTHKCLHVCTHTTHKGSTHRIRFIIFYINILVIFPIFICINIYTTVYVTLMYTLIFFQKFKWII